MIKILNKIPNRICIAVSGGADSMAILDFLTRDKKRDVTVLHFDHCTEHSIHARKFIGDYCFKNKLDLRVGTITRPKFNRESHEEYWRNMRYEFFESYSFLNCPIITCHNLDDVMETWTFTSIHGKSRLIPYKRKNIIRPFLITPKRELLLWCHNKNVPYVNDPSNVDTRYMRNFIRLEIMPKILHVNPGLEKVIFKKIINEYKNKNETKRK